MAKLFDKGRPIQLAEPYWEFGEPTLMAQNNADAVWTRGFQGSSTQQKGGTGWVANLYGGLQTGDDWAVVFIPVNEMPVPDFNTAKWTYFLSATETMGINIVIWVHDPDDFDKRAEITQLGGHADLEKAAGQNAFEFSNSTGGMFFYGENTTGTDLTAATQYTWLNFQQDALFKNWVIYRVSIEYGWEASGTFDNAWVEEIVLNDQVIPLKPDSGGSGRIGRRFSTATSGALAATLAPETPYRLLGIELKINTAGTTDESFTVTKDATIGAVYDQLLVTQNTKTPAITDLYLPFGVGYEFSADDELDAACANTENRTWGLTWKYQTVF